MQFLRSTEELRARVAYCRERMVYYHGRALRRGGVPPEILSDDEQKEDRWQSALAFYQIKLDEIILGSVEDGTP
jgi:hypothetical protein